MVNENQAAKIKIFATMLKFSHDLFDSPNAAATAVKIVTDSRAMLNFRNSALFERTSGGKFRLLGQFAQPESNPFSESAMRFEELAKKAEKDPEQACIISQDLPQALSGDIPRHYLCCKLDSPVCAGNIFHFIWILEYDTPVQNATVNAAKLLGHSAAEALTLAKLAENHPVNAAEKRLSHTYQDTIA